MKHNEAMLLTKNYKTKCDGELTLLVYKFPLSKCEKCTMLVYSFLEDMPYAGNYTYQPPPPPLYSFQFHPLFGSINKRTWNGYEWIYHCHNGNAIEVTESEMTKATDSWLLEEGQKKAPEGGYLE